MGRMGPFKKKIKKLKKSPNPESRKSNGNPPEIQRNPEIWWTWKIFDMCSVYTCLKTIVMGTDFF